MNVTFVNPRIHDTPNRPLGILYIAAILEREGHKVDVIDPFPDETVENICHNILQNKPDLVGITSTTPQIIRGLEIAKQLKSIIQIPIILGGVHPTVVPGEIIKHDFVDYVVIGEGEETTRKLCEKIEGGLSINELKGIAYKEGKEVRITKPRDLIADLDSIPFPARHLLPSSWYSAPPRLRGVWTNALEVVITSRGCPFNCTFCGSHMLFGHKVRRRSPENVLEELEHLREDFKVDSVWFADDTFTLDSKWVERFCELLLEKKWDDFVWVAQARVDTVKRDVLRKMKRAGCIQLDFGVESGSQTVLNTLRKGTKLNQIKQAFNIAREEGIRRFASFVIGTPGESIEDVELTESLIDEIKPDFTEFYYLTPYPGTELYEYAIKHNLIDINVPYNNWAASKQADEPVMHNDFTKEELIRIRSRLHNKVFSRNYVHIPLTPSFLVGMLSVLKNGMSGVPKGFKRFLKTGKLDSIPVEVVRAYRNNMRYRLG